MPASAETALQGLLKDETSADEVLERLSEAGYQVTPPADDGSYEEGGPPMEGEGPVPDIEGIGIVAVDADPDAGEGKAEDTEEEPSDMKSRRKKATKEAFEEHGF